ncbi:MAG: PD40 domain-containing protein, partial [Acidobacteria bacterium]|nr:PD40 domain-containing protein [Acidobacteriota bacterium]
ATRLTVGPGVESDPYFSPDGTRVAFTGEYDGNVDVYVIPAAGGVPRRLTWHPGEDDVCGWTPDGKRILFRSGRASYSRYKKLFTIAVEGGPPGELPLHMAAHGSFSPDGSQIAYMPVGFGRPANSYDSWRRYRGGRATSIWLARLSDSAVVKLPKNDSNDSLPMWIGDSVYFLSDRNGLSTLFAYDTKTRKVAQALANDGLEIKWASAGPGGIVYEQFGRIGIYDLYSRKAALVPVQISGDLPEVRPRREKVNRAIRSASLSPSGVRAVFEARGEILTVPAAKGDPRNISNTPGAHERAPAWSPDGKSIAYWSDAAGEYELRIRPHNGSGEPRQIKMDNPGFYTQPSWSPDSKKVAYTDNRLNVWITDIDQGASTKVDTDTYYDPLGMQFLDPAWSPDSRWLAYTKLLKNHLRAVFLYSLESGRTEQVTDGMSDARYTAFDKDGKHLYFTASTNAARAAAWLDLSSTGVRTTRSAYVMVLRKDLPSPLSPESDEEKEKVEDKQKQPEKKEADKKDASTPVRIDFENIGQRILALPIPARDYSALQTGKSGVLFLVEEPLPGSTGHTHTIHKFDLKTRKTDKLLEGAGVFAVSHDGEKMLYSQAERYVIATTGQPVKPGEGTLKTDAMEVLVDPRAEWKQMYSEVWRLQREFFYDPKFHGYDLRAGEKKYEPYLQAVASRSELNYLFQEMLADLNVGHLYIRGGALPDVKRVGGGLLGADFSVENGRYRFTRVYNGENWNPSLRAPLTQPGVNVASGEYLLAVNGGDVRPDREVYAWFEGTAGKQTVIRVGPDPSGAGARDVTVVPVDSEISLRNLAWIEDNRRKVDQMTGGRAAYVYLPDTGGGGYTNFNRYFFGQIGKEGVIVDERFNGGGQAPDYIVDFLRRPLLNYWTTRYGQDFTTPMGAIYGPKVMITNEFAGSGGDALPWYFRRLGLGPLVGKRTWGGLVGILGFPPLMDGGSVTSPNMGFWSPDGKWDVENYGVAPDVEVEMDPKLVREGHDPQLEKAVEIILEALRKAPLRLPAKPAYPDYSRKPAPANAGHPAAR